MALVKIVSYSLELHKVEDHVRRISVTHHRHFKKMVHVKKQKHLIVNVLNTKRITFKIVIELLSAHLFKTAQILGQAPTKIPDAPKKTRYVVSGELE